MSHSGPHRGDLFKYRKRKKHSRGRYGSGLPYQHYLQLTRFGGNKSRSQYPLKQDYFGVIPEQYRPNIFSPAVDWTEYRQDQDEFTHIPQTPQPHRPLDRPLREHPMAITATEELSMTEDFLMNMGARPRFREGPVPVEFDEIRHLIEGARVPLHTLDTSFAREAEQVFPLSSDIQDRLHIPENEEHRLPPDLEKIADALNILRIRLPEDHPDLINLRQAKKQLILKQFEEAEQGSLFEADDDNWQSKLGPGNPYENDDLIETQPLESFDKNDSPASIQDGYKEVMLEPELLPHAEEPLTHNEQRATPLLFADGMADNTGIPKPMAHQPGLDEMVEQEVMALEAKLPGIEMPMPEAAPGPTSQASNYGPPEQLMGLEIFNTNHVLDEINQAMNQAATPEQPETDPWQMQHDPYQQISMMMDMQMQYMANPFQMPGPMGPGYGPMPGPMMGPM